MKKYGKEKYPLRARFSFTACNSNLEYHVYVFGGELRYIERPCSRIDDISGLGAPVTSYELEHSKPLSDLLDELKTFYTVGKIYLRAYYKEPIVKEIEYEDGTIEYFATFYIEHINAYIWVYGYTVHPLFQEKTQFIYVKKSLMKSLIKRSSIILND